MARLRSRSFLAGVLIAAIIMGGLAVLLALSGRLASPETVAQRYLERLYGQDYRGAYRLISTADKKLKSEEQYVGEKGSLTGFALDAVRQLASYIEYKDIQVHRDGDKATITMKMVVPDGNADELLAVLFISTDGQGELPASQRRALLAGLEELHDSGRLPTYETEQSINLVKEGGTWRVFEDWSTSIPVHFSAEVKHDLPWEFEALQEIVRAKPGEVIRAVYRAKNLSGQPITAKARHIDRPEAYAEHLKIIQCFCLIQRTLLPGEEAELPLTFLLDPETPPEAREFFVHYEFYPIELFPDA